MKAPIKIGLQNRLPALYIERHENFWLIPTNTNKDRSLGAFLRLYDTGKVERVTVSAEPPYEEVWLIKPEKE
ncbi:MAG: hypothetical protein IM561_09095 [Microcystis sp. M60BS1]|uniref:hypothetical protein n=1 Tax=unclassified Microcystis TaxID=2643300 RepID=UPI0025800822|nr:MULTISPECIES: hypothetical protein [unclassified Microcystis]MCA2594404.1 hypothetical protein [Microcystis sp. M38BS1]MCA6581471.1 hypothetical protein [Pseudanabaena sp. M34BS1SP1A06MG]MCA2510525.1 hypothetical protein [Microcystis sp. M60BS1]MCA2555759.1 hypothetical protein [Microcystis sp. M43BS1]MCA2603412.1 hypothetical protein [Microcystis sp. M26BS1]